MKISDNGCWSHIFFSISNVIDYELIPAIRWLCANFNEYKVITINDIDFSIHFNIAMVFIKLSDHGFWSHIFSLFYQECDSLCANIWN